MLFTFQIGLLVFEWGAVRKKNTDLVVLRHILVFCISALSVFVVGFDIAYGGNLISLNRSWFSQGFIE
jgi:ammonia channel protein AmtB